MSKYQDVKLDVVSLGEVKHMLDAAIPNDNTDVGLLSQIKVVLDHVDDQLLYVGNDRRKQISLGDFMSRHHYLNGSSLRQYSNDLLKGQIEKAMGKSEQDSASIDWKMSGIQTHPASHVSGDSNILVDIVDEETDDTKTKPLAEAMQQAVVRDARRITELSAEMTALKNMYENKLMEEYTRDKLNQSSVETLIREYTEARMTDCKLNPTYMKGVQSANGHIYKKVLMEQITKELRITDATTRNEFSYYRTEDAE